MGSIPQLSIVKGKHSQLYPRLLHKIFEERVDKICGDKTALIFRENDADEQKTNYNTLNSSANRIASALLNKIKLKNLQANSDGDWIIAVCMKPSDNLVTTLLAIWKCGAAYLPLDVTFPANRITHILNESKPVLIIHDDDFDRTDVFDANFNPINYNELKEESKTFSNANIEEQLTLTGGVTDIAIVLYTSGSTGVPKGVRLRHSIIQNRLEWQWKTFPYSKTEIYGVFKTALTFVDSVTEIWGPLLNDMALVLVPKEITKNPSKLVEILEEFRIERLVLVPTLLRSLLLFLPLQENSGKLLFNLKTWVCSGEPLSLQLAKEFFDYFEEGRHVLCNFYGSTEVMGDVTYYVCESKNQLDAISRVPIGYALDNTIIYLLDSDFRPVKSEEIGELYVSGGNLASGYVNGRDPERFIDNPLAVDPIYSKIYKTGDFASLIKGVIYYEGRTDSQIKIRGHRVDLTEIEKSLTSLDYVDKGVVLCYHAGEIDQALVAFCVVKGDNMNKYIAKTSTQIENDLKLRLASYMVPQVVVLDSIPLLVNGKIDRQMLLKMYENTNNNDDAEIEFEMDFEGVDEKNLDKVKVLFETVGDSIGRSIRSKLSINANFYELGGNSLNSIYTIAELRKKGFFISITDFITAPTLGIIVECLKTSSDGECNLSSSNLHVQCDLQLTCLPLANEHKEDTIEIITASFYEKADIEQFIKNDILRTDYADILEAIWDVLVAKELSFMIKDSNGRSVGVALNFDARDEPEVEVHSKLIVIFEFLEFVEGPIRDNQLPEGLNQILHSFMMTTSADLNAKENIAVMHFMESEVLKLAKKKKFAGIFTTNTSPLTQQLGSNVYGYKSMLEYPINQYVYRDGTKPFGKAPDTKNVIVHWKDIRNE
ncbi:CLUMA_CG008264, isoform A [Clunio marinus]|uniref:CLUMA_CG008264, isoform A n=1 Tax=Clunio marinus TaxID=568069 RepID=A0A1J1I4T3_9DIPT|nr:CLUMA_CG008264, isoform A [Clunio marinus]